MICIMLPIMNGLLNSFAPPKQLRISQKILYPPVVPVSLRRGITQKKTHINRDEKGKLENLKPTRTGRKEGWKTAGNTMEEGEKEEKRRNNMKNNFIPRSE